MLKTGVQTAAVFSSVGVRPSLCCSGGLHRRSYSGEWSPCNIHLQSFSNLVKPQWKYIYIDVVSDICYIYLIIDIYGLLYSFLSKCCKPHMSLHSIYDHMVYNHRLDASRSRAVWRAWHTGFLPTGRTQPGTMGSCGRPRLAATCQVCNHYYLYAKLIARVESVFYLKCEDLIETFKTLKCGYQDVCS